MTSQEKQQIILSSSLYGCLTKIFYSYPKAFGKKLTTKTTFFQESIFNLDVSSLFH